MSMDMHRDEGSAFQHDFESTEAVNSRKLRGPLAPLRILLSPGRSISRAGKWGLAKVRRRKSRPAHGMASVTAERLYREDEQSSEEHWCAQYLIRG